MTWNWKQWQAGLKEAVPDHLQHHFNSSSTFWNAVNVEGETDRALGLLGGAFVEAALDGLIKARLVNDDVGQKVLDANVFAKKITLAAALGLIRSAMSAEMKHVCDIRNAFAHTLGACDFNSPKVKALVDKLYVMRPHPELEIDWHSVAGNRRDAFMWEVDEAHARGVVVEVDVEAEVHPRPVDRHVRGEVGEDDVALRAERLRRLMEDERQAEQRRRRVARHAGRRVVGEAEPDDGLLQVGARIRRSCWGGAGRRRPLRPYLR